MAVSLIHGKQKFFSNGLLRSLTDRGFAGSWIIPTGEEIERLVIRMAGKIQVWFWQNPDRNNSASPGLFFSEAAYF